jgi:hypothetical protein
LIASLDALLQHDEAGAARPTAGGTPFQTPAELFTSRQAQVLNSEAKSTLTEIWRLMAARLQCIGAAV